MGAAVETTRSRRTVEGLDQNEEPIGPRKEVREARVLLMLRLSQALAWAPIRKDAPAERPRG